MGEPSRRDRVGLGLIGLGPIWEQQYREPLLRLRNRLTIRAVYDPVAARAKTIASEYEAEVVGSLRQLLARHSLKGLLVLDPGWFGLGLLSLAARCGKPVFLASPILRTVSEHFSGLTQAHFLTSNSETPANPFENSDDQLMPELAYRLTPSSCRLQELIATKLGVPLLLNIDCDLTADRFELAALIDWCTDIMGQSPLMEQTLVNSLSRPAQDDSPAASTRLIQAVQFTFPSKHSTTTPLSSHLRYARLHHQSRPSSMRIEVECERGQATLDGRTQIHWRTATESAHESLTDERTEIEILIDQFCRRALGGLNPVGRMSEWIQAVQIAQVIQGR